MADRPAIAPRRLACSNGRFDVFLDRVSGAGEERVDYLVVAPRVQAAGLVTGVAVLPVRHGRIGLLSVYRHPIGGNSWEIPRGFVEDGESLETAAVRELTEETGLACEHARLVSLGPMTPDAGIFAARVNLFVAQDCVPLRPFPAAEFGHRLLRFMPVPEFERMIDASDIQDSYTLVAGLRGRAAGLI